MDHNVLLLPFFVCVCVCVSKLMCIITKSITKSSSFVSSFVAAHEEMRKLIETMPHPTRVDSLSWKLKYFYESCTALEHIVVPEQKLIRVIDQMGNVSLSFFLFFSVCLSVNV